MVLRHSNNKHDFTLAEKAVLTTILYSDIFHFPLRKEEIWKFLISNYSIATDAFDHGLHTLSGNVLVSRDGYYCLSGNSDAIKKRKEKSIYVQRKILFARRIAEKLSVIPTIIFIGISGSVAANNAAEKDDIDFFVITKRDTLFITRFFITIFLEMMHVRRRRFMDHSPDKICVNLLLDESAMRWDEKARSVYTAREIVQIVPLIERNNCYRRFLACNDWVSAYMPNAIKSIHDRGVASPRNGIMTKILRAIPFSLLEPISRYSQLRYMKRHRTREIIRNNYLGFHPVDYGMKVLTQLGAKLRQFGLLTID